VGLIAGLDQVPAIAVQIEKDRDGPVGFVTRHFTELHAAFTEELVRRFEVGRRQEERDSSPRLLSDRLLLRRVDRPGQQQSACSTSIRGHHHPAFAGFERPVGDEVESQLVNKKANRLVVVTHDESRQGKLMDGGHHEWVDGPTVPQRAAQDGAAGSRSNQITPTGPGPSTEQSLEAAGKQVGNVVSVWAARNLAVRLVERSRHTVRYRGRERFATPATPTNHDEAKCCISGRVEGTRRSRGGFPLGPVPSLGLIMAAPQSSTGSGAADASG